MYEGWWMNKWTLKVLCEILIRVRFKYLLKYKNKKGLLLMKNVDFLRFARNIKSRGTFDSASV